MDYTKKSKRQLVKIIKDKQKYIVKLQEKIKKLKDQILIEEYIEVEENLDDTLIQDELFKQDEDYDYNDGFCVKG